MNLALIALAVTDEKIFDIVDEQRTDERTDDGTCPSYKLSFKPSAQGELKTSFRHCRFLNITK